MFYKIGALKKFRKIYRKMSLLESATQVFSCEICEIIMNNFHRTPVTASNFFGFETCKNHCELLHHGHCKSLRHQKLTFLKKEEKKKTFLK